MRQIIFCLSIWLLAQVSLAEDAQVKLLNPDGTPAVDAKAITIMKIWSRVDENLKELPSLTMPMPEGGGTKAAKNDAGVITFDSKAIAVLAQNQSGFVFAPLPLKSDTVRLRPWAKLKIDLSAMDPKKRESLRVAVLWENCFAGNALRPANAVKQQDPFGQDNMVPEYDWRFDPFVMLSLSLEAKAEQVVNVPPGEVTLLFGNQDIAKADWQKPLTHTRESIIRTRSRNTVGEGNVVEYKAPELVSVRGELFDADVPDWNGGAGNSRFVFASPANPENGELPDEIAQLFTGLDQGSGTILDELAKRYASEVGMKYRYGLMPQATAEVKEDDTFEFPCLPPGKYNLTLILNAVSTELKRRGVREDAPIVVEVTSQSSTLDLGQLVRLQRPEPKVAAETLLAPTTAESKPSPIQAPPEAFGSDPVVAAEQRINAVLKTVIDGMNCQGSPLWQVAEDLQLEYRIPILVNQETLAKEGLSADAPVTFKVESITLQSALRHLLASVSSELTFVVRDEVLLITTKEDAATSSNFNLSPNVNKAEQTEQLDNGAAFIAEWQKTAANVEDREALKKALRSHLEQEFEANQTSRTLELERLSKLLKQSEDWIKTRQSRKAEIVNRRLMELLNNE